MIRERFASVMIVKVSDNIDRIAVPECVHNYCAEVYCL